MSARRAKSFDAAKDGSGKRMWRGPESEGDEYVVFFFSSSEGGNETETESRASKAVE